MLSSKATASLMAAPPPAPGLCASPGQLVPAPCGLQGPLRTQHLPWLGRGPGLDSVLCAVGWHDVHAFLGRGAVAFGGWTSLGLDSGLLGWEPHTSRKLPASEFPGWRPRCCREPGSPGSPSIRTLSPGDAATWCWARVLGPPKGQGSPGPGHPGTGQWGLQAHCALSNQPVLLAGGLPVLCCSPAREPASRGFPRGAERRPHSLQGQNPHRPLGHTGPASTGPRRQQDTLRGPGAQRLSWSSSLRPARPLQSHSPSSADPLPPAPLGPPPGWGTCRECSLHALLFSLGIPL